MKNFWGLNIKFCIDGEKASRVGSIRHLVNKLDRCLIDHFNIEAVTSDSDLHGWKV